MNYNQMRRIEKKLSEKEAFKIIEKAKFGVLSLSLDGSPYGVPLSPALDGEILYFHCANEGLKLDIIKKSPKGHFVFVSKAKVLSEKATVDYKSAMVHGALRIVNEDYERKKAYDAIIKKYMKKYPNEAKKTIDKNDVKTTIVAMDIEGVSAKGNTNQNSNTKISDPITINNLKIKNRIVMPPLFRIGHKRENGMLDESDYEYYISRAKNGTGLVVVEATAVDKNGLCSENGLRLWSDKYIDQFKKLTAEVKEHGAKIFIQLQHGGYKSDKKLTKPMSSSDYKDGIYRAKKMTTAQANKAVESFAQAALRAQKCGFDGVELHGCHGYLINQFSCPSINKRKDEYKTSSYFGTTVIKRIKELCSEDFIISVRTAVDIPTLKNSINTAIDYQNAGADMLSVSRGINNKEFSAPKKWKHSNVSYLAFLVKKKVHIPVVGVYGITSPKIANDILTNKYFDMVAVGRNHLIHDDWAKRALQGGAISQCKLCKKGCYFHNTLKKCPAVETAKKKGY